MIDSRVDRDGFGRPLRVLQRIDLQSARLRGECSGRRRFRTHYLLGGARLLFLAIVAFFLLFFALVFVLVLCFAFAIKGHLTHGQTWFRSGRRGEHREGYRRVLAWVRRRGERIKGNSAARLVPHRASMKRLSDRAGRPPLPAGATDRSGPKTEGSIAKHTNREPRFMRLQSEESLQRRSSTRRVNPLVLCSPIDLETDGAILRKQAGAPEMGEGSSKGRRATHLHSRVQAGNRVAPREGREDAGRGELRVRHPAERDPGVDHRVRGWPEDGGSAVVIPQVTRVRVAEAGAACGVAPQDAPSVAGLSCAGSRCCSASQALKPSMAASRQLSIEPVSSRMTAMAVVGGVGAAFGVTSFEPASGICASSLGVRGP